VQVAHPELLSQMSLPSGVRRRERRPGTLQQFRQMAVVALQGYWGRIPLDVVEQPADAALRLLEAANQFQRLRIRFQRELQHPEANHAFVQRTAALMGQHRHHLADGCQPLGLEGARLGLLQPGGAGQGSP
jgi:hypothetical protein